MSDSDRAIYAEMLENNPADLMIANGEDLVEEYCMGEEGIANFLKVTEGNLSIYLAGFPRYLAEFKQVVSIEQMLQGLMSKHGNKPFKLESPEMFDMDAYVKSIANDEKVNIDINANVYMKEAYQLGKKTYMLARGGRGLSCNSCHSKEVSGQILRTQTLQNITSNDEAISDTWPAYRMTKSSLATLQKRMQGCMKNALMKAIPLGSPEMVALEVYITEKSKGRKISIPGLKR